MERVFGRVKEVVFKEYSFLSVLALVALIASIRVLAERVFLLYFHDLSHIFSTLDQGSVRFLLENVYYFLIVFIASTAFVARLAGLRLLEVMNFGLRLYPVIILPPLIDGLIFGRHEGYSYATLANFGWNFFTLSFIRGDASPGIAIECLLAFSGMLFYVLGRTKSFWKGAVTFLFIDVLVVFMSTPEIIFGEYADYHFDPFLPLYYFFPFLLLLVALVYSYDKRKLTAAFKNLRLERAVVFVSMVFLGGLVRRAEGVFIDEWSLILGMVIFFLVWQVSVMVNDVHDLAIDRISNSSRPLPQGLISRAEYEAAAMVLSFVALSCSIVIGPEVFLLTVFAVGLAYAYSVRPLRLRNTLWGNVLIALSAAGSLYVGFLAAGGGGITVRMAFLLAAVFLLSSVISLSKDVKDVSGDKENGVVNLFTLYGESKARVIVCWLMFFVLNGIALLFIGPLFLLINSAIVYLYYRFSLIALVYFAGVLNAVMMFQGMYHG